MNSSSALKLLNHHRPVATRLHQSLACFASSGKKLCASDTFFRHRCGGSFSLTTKRGFASMMNKLKELRNASGAPIVDCKKALTEMGGDIEKSMDWLRQHGTAKASKKVVDREAEEGLVACALSEDRKSASIVKISSETDFAGKSDAFVGLACHVAGATLGSSSMGDLDPQSVVLNLEFQSKSVQTALEEAIVSIRENLGVQKAVKMTTGGDGLLVAYVHGKVDGTRDAGLAAAIVEISGNGIENNPEVAIDTGKKLAMHIVAAKPAYLNSGCIPTDVIEKEKTIFESQIANSDKPPEVVKKIIDGRMRKFYSEVCLTEQEHLVEEGNPKVSKALKENHLIVKSFERFSI